MDFLTRSTYMKNRKYPDRKLDPYKKHTIKSEYSWIEFKLDIDKPGYQIVSRYISIVSILYPDICIQQYKSHFNTS